MDNIYELIKEINKLPKGNVYQKNIKGHIYFYHQYFEGKKRITKLVSIKEKDILVEKIKRRNDLEKKLKEICQQGNKHIELSSSAREYTGSIMLKDTRVSTFNKGILTWMDQKLAPLIVLRTHNIESFLKTRTIDTSRTNARLLKKVLNLGDIEDEKLSLCSYASSVVDDYWFKPYKSKLKFKDITLKSNLFFDVSLNGLISIYSKKRGSSPDLTTGGSYEKSWKNIKGEWWLYKKGTENEIFSELLYSKLFEAMNLKTAHYEYDDGNIRTKNFSIKYNYEPLIGLVGEDEDYEKIYHILHAIDSSIAKDYLILILFDVCFNNIDRHNENCGILRDKKTGKIVSLAPNFDNNLSFISRDENLDLSTNEGFLKFFTNYVNSHKTIKEAYKNIDIPELNEGMIKKYLAQIPIKKDSHSIIRYIINRHSFLVKNIKH